MKVFLDQEFIYNFLEECRQLPGTFTKDQFWAFEKEEELYLGCYINSSNYFYLIADDVSTDIESIIDKIEKNAPELSIYIPQLLEAFIRFEENKRMSNKYFDAH